VPVSNTTLLLGAIVVLALLLYLWWENRDRRVEDAVSREAEDLRSMGELVATSLHPKIDPGRCIGSRACISSCPEKVVIGLINGRAELVNPLACVGHGACEVACPVNAISLVYGTRTRGVELPRVSPDFETNQPGIYIVGELGGMGLIRNAVMQGQQAVAHILRGSDAGPRRGVDGALDVLVIGAGPAGISATLACMAGQLNVLLVEREAFGGTIAHYPRAKVVMTGTLDLPLYGPVRQRKMSKEELVGLWTDIRTRTSPPLSTGELCESIQRDPDGMWRVLTDRGQHRAANVVLALGVRGSPRKLGVPGEDLPKVAYRLLEPEEFAEKHVIVVGGGNSAVESALSLSDSNRCASVAISYRRDKFARCRAENRRRIDEAIANGRVTPLLGTELVDIAEDRVTIRGHGADTERANDALIVQIGGTAPADLLRSFGVELVTKYGVR
jgi:thioredoxin reductase (NADPH)